MTLLDAYAEADRAMYAEKRSRQGHVSRRA